MPIWQVETRSEAETIDAGRALGPMISGIVVLTGTLGAGKTTLTKGIAEALGAATVQEVSSPTFTLIHEYGNPVRLYHVDLYRLEDDRAVESTGLDEVIRSGVPVLVEWGRRFGHLLPREHMEIQITEQPGGRRLITLEKRP